MSVSRREFVKKSCLACASIASIGAVASILESCSPLVTMKVIPNNGLIDVPLTQFTETNKLVILRNFDKLDFDIAVVKLGENQYKALEMQCTHVPNNHLVATDSGFHCNTHGSSFSFDGQVVESPAQRPMKEFPIEINNHTIQIKL